MNAIGRNFRKTSLCIPLILLCLLTLIPSFAFCDDALLKVYGGGLELFDGGSSSVSMTSEIVKIDLHKNTYTVDATFEFHNHGKTITSQVGFPENGYGYAPSFRGVINLNNFESWINGKKVNVKEMPGEATLNGRKVDAEQLVKIRKGELSGPFQETRWLVKKVAFRGHAKTITRVKYTAPYGGQENDKGEYLYGSGKSWKGAIGIARFIVKASPEVSLIGDPAFTEGGYGQNIRHYEFKRVGGYEYEYTLKDIEPKDNEKLKFIIMLNSVPWDLTSEYSEKHVEHEELRHLSLWQLRILRNAIYAFHGKIFKDPDLNKYFRKYDWYKPRRDFKYSDLNNIEKDNIAEIAAYEKELKAASHK